MDVTEDRHELKPGVNMDESGDTGEPAFEWMKTPAGPAAAHRADERAGAHDAADVDHADHADTGVRSETEAANSSEAPAADPSADLETQRPAKPERVGAHFEPSPTSALQMRPPEDEVRRRNAQREAAANAKPVAPRVLQVLMAIFLPFLLLIAAVRVVATPAYLWLEYFRPGFPGDGYGFSADDRLTYGSYAVDYLSNFAGARYLGDLVQPSGSPLFTSSEVSHMADVKLVIMSAYGAGLVLLLFFVVSYLVMRKRRGAFGRGLFAGAIVTFVLVVGLAVFAVLGWQQFFTEFHRLFFANGTWTFQLSDTLIRLFPSQFWMDAAIVIGVLVLVVSSLMIIFAWPTKKNAEAAEGAQE
ncbi:MAG: TIGR01906 family membrane protein [Sinomonas sp.]|nr:TIGR01906 family membrane protein [Sinomonas sp.]